jgi:hypothetical protein
MAKCLAKLLRQPWLGWCPVDLELCFSSKQLWLPCSFFQVTMEHSKKLVLA